MSRPLTVLFQSRNRRGLGHLMRGLNIAREVLAVRPDARVIMHTRNASAPEFCPPSVECLVDDGTEGAAWIDVLAAMQPDVVVYDTMLPDEPQSLPSTARVVYVMRKSRPEQHRALLADPFVHRVNAVVVPHTREEFGHRLPAALDARTAFVGLVARRPEPDAQVRLRPDPGPFLLVSTAGGGGFAHSAEPFFEAVAATCRALAERPPARGLQHVVVLGPHCAGAPALPGASVVRSVPALVDLLAVADLVVSEGGYNSVAELRLVRTPAVFLPGERTYDDQAERVTALALRGAALCLQGAPAEQVARQVTALVHDPARLAAMRASYAGDDLPLGNRAAAEHVLGPHVRPSSGAA